jgi:O-antigen/teichoic acid export membrane protein
MYFKAVSWAIGFIFLAKGASKLFFWSELVASSYMLLFNILGYKYFGLTGMGFSFLISYILVLIQVYFIAKIKYEFSFSSEFYKIFGIQLLLGITCFAITMFVSSFLAYIIGLPFILISTWYSFKELDKRMDLKGVINNYRKNNDNRK